MKLFALKDAADPDAATLAVLSCYGDGPEREYYIDMPADADPWAVPLVLSSFAKRGRWVVGPAWAKRWVDSRVVPPSRQNIGEVLRENGLSDYDELALLEASAGRNSQDDCYLERLRPGDAPAWYAEREAHRVVEAVPLAGPRLLVCFRVGEARSYGADDLMALNAEMGRVFAADGAFERVQVSSGGRGVRWGTSVRIGDDTLADAGEALPLSWEDFARIAPELLVDAAQTAAMLGCTRQNVNALMKRGALPAVKASGKATLFLRADVRARADAR